MKKSKNLILQCVIYFSLVCGIAIFTNTIIEIINPDPDIEKEEILLDNNSGQLAEEVNSIGMPSLLND